jgi:hypothetical protein
MNRNTKAQMTKQAKIDNAFYADFTPAAINWYVPAPAALPVPDKNQFVTFLQKRGDDYFWMSCQSLEDDPARSDWYGKQAVIFWENAQYFRVRGQWDFSLWYENNEQFCEDFVYPFADYQEETVTVDTDLFVEHKGIIAGIFTGIRQALAA